MKATPRVALAMGLAPLLLVSVLSCAREGSRPRTVKVAVTELGFEPAEIRVRSGEVVRLLVTRRTDATCAKEIVIAEQGIRKELPLNEEVRIEFTPERPGDMRYVCGMDMISGTIKVE